MSETAKGFSRRNFLKAGSLATLAGAAVLTGCSTSETPAEETDESTVETISLDTPADNTEECDVVIIGAGGAGVWAAIEAIDAGKSVIAVEKGADIGTSNGSIAGGPLMVGSKLQQEAGIDFDIETAFTHVMEYGHWATNAPATKAALALSGDTIDRFTDEFGVPTGMRPDNYGAGFDSIRANFQTDPTDPSSQLRGVKRFGPLQTWIEEKGGVFHFNTTGKKLIMEDGLCVGIRCENEEGILDIMAKAVIISTGGFLGSADMMLQHFGTEVNALGNKLSIGEGIEMVQEVGGQLSTQWGIAGNEFAGSNKAATPIWSMTSAPATIGIYGTLLVNNQGRRFADEGKFANLPLALGGAISMLGGQYYAVVDQAYIDGLNSGVDAWTLCGSDSENWFTGSKTLQNRPLENVQADMDAAVEAGVVFKADTIEELNDAIGATDLVETLDTYNQHCESGKDEDFYKPSCFLQPVTTAPFYALQYEPSAWVTIGGIRTNDHLQAIDAQGMPISGLYVAGADNGTLMSAPYCDYEGYSLMCAYNGGRLAGQYACADIDNA